MTNKYIGTKVVLADPMTRAEYNAYRGFELPADENGEDEGYLVEYVGQEQSNHPNHNGYISWSPKAVFERSYMSTDDGFDFGSAIRLMKAGLLVARKGWNGKGMFLFLVQGSQFKVNRAPLLGIFDEGTEINYHAHIDMRTATGEIVPWLASQTDMLAEDWVVVSPNE